MRRSSEYTDSFLAAGSLQRDTSNRKLPLAMKPVGDLAKKSFGEKDLSMRVPSTFRDL